MFFFMLSEPYLNHSVTKQRDFFFFFLGGGGATIAPPPGLAIAFKTLQIHRVQ